MLRIGNLASKTKVILGIAIAIILAGCVVVPPQAKETTNQENNILTQKTSMTNSARLIPLQDIWAWDMPGTRPLNRTETGNLLPSNSPELILLSEIISTLTSTPNNFTPDQCFAVEGEGKNALQEAHAVIVKKQAKKTSFSQDQKISLVFFSYPFNSYVHLVRVEQQDQSLQIFYRFVTHRTRQMTVHIALIPVNLSASGNTQVEIKSQPATGNIAGGWEQWEQKIICRPFNFNVTPTKT